jgi:thiamine biosynthesis lipoprotein
MNTLVTIRVLTADTPDANAPDANAAIDRAFGWFHEIERRCSRFDSASELMQLTAGDPTPVSPILYEAVRFALMVADMSDGAFDPTVGRRMQARGFDREHRTGQILRQPDHEDDDSVSYRDLRLDPESCTITLLRPLTLDLGAVAKGLAVDAAVRELEALENFVIDAGGDLYLGGLNERGAPWSVGIRHPRHDGETIASLYISNQAVCTSGDYERANHLLDPRTGSSPHNTVASATVVAPNAMLADALATAVFVLGPTAGIDLLHRLGLEGLVVTSALQQHATRGLPRAA